MDNKFIAIATKVIKRGGTYKDVGEATGTSKNTAASRCMRLGLRSKNKRGRPVGSEGPRLFDYAEAARMQKEGATLSVIAEHFGVSKQAIHQGIKKLQASAPRRKATRR